MIVPVVDPVTGDAVQASWGPGVCDSRVPPSRVAGQPARLLGAVRPGVQCPAGRHVWDALVAVGTARLDDDLVEEAGFELRLTCVRCGVLERLVGVLRDDDAARDCLPTRVDPVPVQVDGWVAQHVDGELGTLRQSWAVHAAAGDPPVGVIRARLSRSGEYRFEGALTGWLSSRTVRAGTVQLVLAGLARLAREGARS